MNESIEEGVRDFRDLFRGSATLGLLLGASSLEWTRVVPFVSGFTPELSQAQVFTIHSQDTRVEVGTRGEGKDFVHRATHLMEQHGIGEDELKRFLTRAAFVEHQNLFFSMDVREDEVTSFSYTLRRRQPLEVGTAMLVDAGVTSEGLAIFRDAARILQKDVIHAFSASQGTDGDGRQVVFFSQPRDLESWKRVNRMAEALGVEAQWETFRVHETLPGALAMIGVVFSPGATAPTLALIFRELSEQAISLFGLSPAGASRAETLLRICGRKRFSFVEVLMHPSDPVGLKFSSS